MQGNTLLRDLHILKLASEHFDGGASAQMFRSSDDSLGYGMGDDPSPYILAVMVDMLFVFELYVERSKLLGNMNFVTAIAAFFHLCFIMDLKYPKQSQTLADLLQRRVCKYGDESGTRTWKLEDSAEKKYQFFCSRVFKLTN